ncbi:MAG: prepilin-type N-terminal cleavage/methylation domain-containing protein, partial [bacterium]
MFNLNDKGQSLLEVIVAMAVFSLIGATMASMVVGGNTALERGKEHTQAQAISQQGIEAVRAVRDMAWNDLKYLQSGVTTSSGQWILKGEGTSDIIDQYTRTIGFNNVCRDVNGDIVNCPSAYTDPHTKELQVQVNWSVRPGVSNTSTRSFYLTNWDSLDWIQTDWSGGSGQNIWSDQTKYESDDDNLDAITTPGQIMLGSGTEHGQWVLNSGSEFTDTSDINFGAGSSTGAVVDGTGDDASIILSQTGSGVWSEHPDSGDATSRDMLAITAISTNDIWAGGKNGRIIKYNGVNWVETTVPSANQVNGISAVDSNNVWAVGQSGSIWHYNGISWSATTSPTSEELRGISMLSANQGWIAGKKGKILYYNGTNWS